MSINLFDLTGKTALITGGVHGLGMAMAKGLGHAGAKIVVNDRSSREAVDNAVAEYKSVGIDAYGYLFDVTDEKAVIASIKQIEAEVGPIDILINNAGIIKRTPIIEMEVEDFTAVITVDLISPFIVSELLKRGPIFEDSNGTFPWCKTSEECLIILKMLYDLQNEIYNIIQNQYYNENEKILVLKTIISHYKNENS